MTSASAATSCQFCDKQGLFYLPVRHAVARKDMGNAPALATPFVVAKDDPHKDKLALPAALAHYTLRLLRPGYLYQYDEHRREWTGYMVMDGAYLFAFDIHAKAPPSGWGKVQFSCSRQGDAVVARCIAIKDAKQATKVWLAYSDVMWTPDTLQKHEDASYRTEHMQCLNVAAWRQGTSQANVANLSALTQVAEFAADAQLLHRETRAYVERFVPKPYKSYKTWIEASTGAAGRESMRLASGLLKDLLLGASSPATAATTGRVIAAAWAFSPHDFYLAGSHLAFLELASQASAPLPPALIALDDPAGVAMELNGLYMQLSAEFTEDPARKWQHETALAIDLLKQGVKEGQLKKARDMVGIDTAMDQVAYAETHRGSGLIGKPSTYAQDLARNRELAEQTGAASGDIEWADKYAKCFNEPAQQTYLQQYPQDLSAYANTHLAPLDKPAVAWMRSETLARYFSHNFDPKNLSSGDAYTALATAMLHNASGRSAVAEFISESLKHEPTNPKAWVLRAQGLNNDEMIAKWAEVAAEKGGEKEVPWKELAEKLHEKFANILLMAEAGKLDGRLGAIGRFTYQLAGPLVTGLSDGIDAGAAHLVGKSRNLQRSLIGWVAKAENPNMELIELHGTWDPKEAARTLARALARLGGGSEQGYRFVAQASVMKLANDGKTPFHAVLLVDPDKVRAATGKGAAALAGAVSAQEFESLLEEDVGKLLNGEVKAGAMQGVLAFISLRSAFGDMLKAGPEAFKAKFANFVSGVVSLTGGLAETMGNLLEHTPWGQSPLAFQWKVMAIKVESRATWLTGMGKLCGVAGGIVAGVVELHEGIELREKRPTLGWLSIGIGSGSIIGSLLVAAGMPGVGIVIGLVVVILLVVKAWLTPNALQEWLNKTGFFGAHEYGDHFSGLADQTLAYAALAHGVAGE